MKPPSSVLAQRQVTLLDLVDRILEKGVVLSADITLAVADVDLVQLNLQALLASVETKGSRTNGDASS
jgi:Gas vesicle protein